MLISELKLIVMFAINTVDINGTITLASTPSILTWDSTKTNTVNLTLITNVYILKDVIKRV